MLLATQCTAGSMLHAAFASVQQPICRRHVPRTRTVVACPIALANEATAAAAAEIGLAALSRSKHHIALGVDVRAVQRRARTLPGRAMLHSPVRLTAGAPAPALLNGDRVLFGAVIAATGPLPDTRNVLRANHRLCQHTIRARRLPPTQCVPRVAPETAALTVPQRRPTIPKLPARGSRQPFARKQLDTCDGVRQCAVAAHGLAAAQLVISVAPKHTGDPVQHGAISAGASAISKLSIGRGRRHARTTVAGSVALAKKISGHRCAAELDIAIHCSGANQRVTVIRSHRVLTRRLAAGDRQAGGSYHGPAPQPAR